MKQTIRHILYVVSVALAVVSVAACQHRELFPSAERVSVRFVIDEPLTKACGVSNADEKCINRWALLVFDKYGFRVAEGFSSNNSGIDAVLDAGTYTVCAVVNNVISFEPSDYETLSQLEQSLVSLEQNTTSSFVMFGRQSLSLSGGDNGTKSITVSRLVSKVGVRSILVDDSGELAGHQVLLKSMYLTNVSRYSHLGADMETNALPSFRDGWYNTLGLYTGELSVAGLDALLVDKGIDLTVSAVLPHMTEHYFYPFPNRTPSEADSNVASWSRRCTRLVVEASVDGITYYYPVTLPSMQRNHTYIISQAVIRRFGSLDPEGRCSSAIDVTWAVSPDAGWDGPTSITELS